ncbi:MAG: flagellar hook-basal body complex protein FliE [Magnetococcales bacterium]|nr:flagellar hook-basal body complex protein FliE [Magnetococcales bacterium]
MEAWIEIQKLAEQIVEPDRICDEAADRSPQAEPGVAGGGLGEARVEVVKSDLHLCFMAHVRNKHAEAYQEIMNRSL